MRPQAHTPALWIRRLPEGVQGASGKPPACIDKRQLCRKQFPLAGPDAPIPARGKGLQPYGALYCSGGDPKGLGRAESPQCARRRNPQPPVGLDAPTPARIGTGRPKGRSHFSFGGERKVCKRKPAARQLLRPAPLRTAAKPCATLVLGYALHGLRPFRALVGLRPPLVAGFGLR